MRLWSQRRKSPGFNRKPPSPLHVKARLIAVSLVAIVFFVTNEADHFTLSKRSHVRHNEDDPHRSKSYFATGSGQKPPAEPTRLVKEADIPQKAFSEAVTSSNHVWRGAPWLNNVGKWMHENEGSSSEFIVHEKIHGNECPGECSGLGVCNFDLGECRCRHGYKGSDCSELDEYPCNMPSIDDFPLGRRINSICAATCNTRLARCVCGPRSPYPNRQAPSPCGFQSDKEGVVLFEKPDVDSLYLDNSSSPGWCMADSAIADVVPRQECYCNDDGFSGRFCETPNLPYCIAGCSGHGDCFSGYCQCQNGWYGVDCSIPSVRVADPITDPPLWLQSGSPLVNAVNGVKVTVRVQRKRPLIYIYDLPPEFTSDQLQGRLWKYFCVPWMYSPINETEFNFGYLYGMELVLYEALLGSPHRTTNPDEADYFFVPVLSGCIIARAGESPRISGETYGGVRSTLMAKYVLNASIHIQENYPFWNRSGGRDHIWSFPWDEGGCYAPQSVAQSIFLTPWGNTLSKHNSSTTAYWEDDWSKVPKDLRGNHTCFDPSKDIVMPAWKHPQFFTASPDSRRRSFDERPLLFYFSGNLGQNFEVGRPEESYSMGIRQKVASFFSSVKDKNGNLGSLSEEQVVVSNVHSHTYSDQLASSRFCGVFPGDGFSSRMEDSILHGCIPVIVQDGIQLPWENVLHSDSFSVRINEDDIPNMIQVLKNISREEVVSKLENVQKVWQRWTYHSVMKQEAWRQEELHGHRPEWSQGVKALMEDDAIDTLMQVLDYKLRNDKWRGLSS